MSSCRRVEVKDRCRGSITSLAVAAGLHLGVLRLHSELPFQGRAYYIRTPVGLVEVLRDGLRRRARDPVRPNCPDAHFQISPVLTNFGQGVCIVVIGIAHYEGKVAYGLHRAEAEDVRSMATLAFLKRKHFVNDSSLTALAMMSSTVGAVKEAYIALTGETVKAADLAKDTVDLGNPPSKGMTTDHGVYVSDTDNWLKAADGRGSGPSLLEDQIAREKIMRFDHERIPERVVHARGTGAHGYFKVFDNRASKYTFAPVLTDPSRITPTFVRFSTVQSSRGGADTVRDVRGFATKFYTEEGNWDIVGNNIPVFFIQDAIKFPDVVHAVKPEPQNEVPQGQSAHNNFWDFAGLTPETAHMVTWIMSDRAIPRSFRMMQGFGVNTFTLVNAQGKRSFVKFHWIPELGVHSLLWDEALKISGQDPDFHRKDLEEAITTGAYPKWHFGIQVIPEEKENDFEFDILDATKLWPENLVPVEIIGEMILNRTVNEFFTEVEQVAFCTANVVPGIGFSDDPLLQGRNFSYFDTQITRLGVNWQEIPINRPVCPVLNHQRDGQKRHKISKGVNYWPNRFEQTGPVPAKEGGYAEYPQKVAGIKQRVRGAKFQEHFKQAQMFINSLSDVERAHLVSAYSFELSHCDDPTVYESYTKLLQNIDFDLAKLVAINVGGPLPDKAVHPNPGHKATRISQFDFAPKEPTIASRRVAILVADGFNLGEVVAIRSLLGAGMATTWVVGPRRGPVYPMGEEVEKGVGYNADHHWEGQRSTLFDAIIIPGGAKHAQALADSGRCVHWVREAFGHCKAIGALGEGVVFLREAVKLPGIQFAANLNNDNVTASYGVVTAGQYDLGSAAADIFTIKEGEKGFISNFAHELSKHRCYQRELDGLTIKVPY